jgi:hypothetical protein
MVRIIRIWYTALTTVGGAYHRSSFESRVPGWTTGEPGSAVGGSYAGFMCFRCSAAFPEFGTGLPRGLRNHFPAPHFGADFPSFPDDLIPGSCSWLLSSCHNLPVGLSLAHRLPAAYERSIRVDYSKVSSLPPHSHEPALTYGMFRTSLSSISLRP